MSAQEEQEKKISVNRKARFNFYIEDTLECGIELKGTEVKSIKAGKLSYTDSYAKVENNELWLVGLHISPYDFGNIHNHDPDRIRRLLAHRKEIKRLKRKIMEKGLTLIPLRFYLVKGIVKIELGICKGKKVFDKREEIKKKDLKRIAEREYKIS
jgi:SsrA-binding protein